MTLSVFRSLELTGNALSAQRTRLDVVSSNLANAQTTRGPDGGPYRRRDVVMVAEQPRDAFGLALSAELGPTQDTVRVDQIREDPSPPRRVYEPDHPDADAAGYVAYPNINTVEEMVNMITAMRSYQANLSVFNSYRDMTEKSLGIGRPI